MKNLKIDLTPAKRLIAENPEGVALIALALFGATASMMNANTARVNAKTWRKEVNRRSNAK